mmetsp:Transcript_17096/g.55831  ORF Transcript_17096/g.55831 Transcript_17096/m.55831 type:complete len:308 (-) Transcript_17096:576-1499(-)
MVRSSANCSSAEVPSSWYEIACTMRCDERPAAETTSLPSAGARRNSASAREASTLTRIRPLTRWGRGLCASSRRTSSPATRVSMPTMRSFRATGASEQSISSRSGGGGGGRPPHTAAPPNEGPRLDVPRRAAAGIPPGEGVVIPPGGPPASRDASAAHERAMASSRDSKLSSGGGSHSNTGGGAWAAPAQTDLCSPTGAGEAKCPVVVAKAAAAVASAEAAAATRAGRLVDGRDRRSLFCRCPAPQTRLGAAARQYMPRTRTPGRRGTGGTAPATEPNLDASSAAEANRRRLRGRPSAMASHFKSSR